MDSVKPRFREDTNIGSRLDLDNKLNFLLHMNLNSQGLKETSKQTFLNLHKPTTCFSLLYRISQQVQSALQNVSSISTAATTMRFRSKSDPCQGKSQAATEMEMPEMEVHEMKTQDEFQDGEVQEKRIQMERSLEKELYEMRFQAQVEAGEVQEEDVQEKREQDKEFREKAPEDETTLQATATTRKPYITTQLYHPLSIRIAILSPGTFNSIPSITLEVRTLSVPDLGYEAISYCWSQGIGDTIEDTWDFEVKCGEETLLVPRNLGRALRRLRYQDTERLWMDSVCIDQQRVEEKNVQVAMMGRIFATARQVVVWLGEEDRDTKSAYETIRLLARAGEILAKQDQAIVCKAVLTNQVSEVAGLRRVSRTEIQVMADLQQRAWFERAWVFQESALALGIVVKTGFFEIEGFNIVSMLDCRNHHGMSYIGVKPENQSALDRAYAMFLPLEKRSELGANFWQDLFWMLRARRGAKASDPRDIIYSLLGVASGGKASLIVPDYNQTWQHLYIWIARRIVEETRALDILGQVSPVSTAFISASSTLPSWVPDWRLPLDESAKFSIISNIRAGPRSRLLRATGWSQASLLDSQAPFSARLRIHGIHVDNVENIQPSADWTSWTKFQQFMQEERYWPTQEPMRLACIKMLSLDASRWNANDPNFAPNGALSHVEDYRTYMKDKRGETDLSIMFKMARIRRKILLTSTGFLGVASDSVKIGDKLTLLPGAEFPILLRRCPRRGDEYKFVGECYIHGLMNGQGMAISEGQVVITGVDMLENALPLSDDKRVSFLSLEEIIIC